jgi:hypothetical protein
MRNILNLSNKRKYIYIYIYIKKTWSNASDAYAKALGGRRERKNG